MRAVNKLNRLMKINFRPLLVITPGTHIRTDRRSNYIFRKKQFRPSNGKRRMTTSKTPINLYFYYVNFPSCTFSALNARIKGYTAILYHQNRSPCKFLFQCFVLAAEKNSQTERYLDASQVSKEIISVTLKQCCLIKTKYRLLFMTS